MEDHELVYESTLIVDTLLFVVDDFVLLKSYGCRLPQTMLECESKGF